MFVTRKVVNLYRLVSKVSKHLQRGAKRRYMVVKATKYCLDPFGKSCVQQRKQGIAASGGRPSQDICGVLAVDEEGYFNGRLPFDVSPLCAGVGVATLACIWQG